MVSRQQCAFVQFTTRHAAEQAAEKSFNKLILQGRRLTIKWGRAQGQQIAIRREGEEDESALEPVPGLPGGMKCTLVISLYFMCTDYQIILAPAAVQCSH